MAGAILLLIAAYRLAFKRTIEAWQLHTQLQSKIETAGDLSYQPGYLERKNRNIDKILRLYKADTTNLRSNVLSTITSIALTEDVKLADVPGKDPFLKASQSSLEKLTFEGDYSGLVKTLDKLRSTANIGVIRSVTIKSVRAQHQTDKTNKTLMDVYFEVAAN